MLNEDCGSVVTLIAQCETYLQEEHTTHSTMAIQYLCLLVLNKLNLNFFHVFLPAWFELYFDNCHSWQDHLRSFKLINVVFKEKEKIYK